MSQATSLLAAKYLGVVLCSSDSWEEIEGWHLKYRGWIFWGQLIRSNFLKKLVNRVLWNQTKRNETFLTAILWNLCKDYTYLFWEGVQNGIVEETALFWGAGKHSKL